MPSATLELPELLAGVLGGVRHVPVEGKTCRAALEDAFRRHPGLKVHVVDERGALRKHVLCFHNGENTRWSDTLDRPLADGDTLTILQAVSGG